MMLLELTNVTYEAYCDESRSEGTTLANDHLLLTVREVADTMRVSTMTVYRLIRDGDMPAIRVGKHFRLRTEDVDAFLDARMVNAAPVLNGSATSDDTVLTTGPHNEMRAWPVA
jgi:excisionase family DNA binding protein